ncbi:MAG: CoA transferase [Actinomycetota bacterium]|jgi:crotonobetainyl-CoA:carnitine CoA-transferase CaiB-like acyl-CoA transferase|nr:CoA transferase [Actinomycetota bacterium]
MIVPGVLNGVKVVDFSQFIAGPAAGRLMAEMGADVIKLELPPDGDQGRGFPVHRDGASAYYNQWNLGKRSLCVDVRDPRGLALVKELVGQADVLIENFSPGVVGRLGLGWDVVSVINPNLVMCSISAFGQSGPLAEIPGFDFIGQAYAGVTSMIGEPDEPPPLLGVVPGDVGAGVSAVAAINGALLWARSPDGTGQHIDVSLLDFYFHCHGIAVELYTASRGELALSRSGSHHNVVAPMGVFRASDGFVVIVPVPIMWPRLCEAMQRPDLVDDPRFGSDAARMEHREELIEVIEDWLGAQESSLAAVEIMQRHRVPCAPVLSIAQALEHPHLIERGTVRTVPDPHIGPYEVPGMIVKMGSHPEPTDAIAPDLGQHCREIAVEDLGYDNTTVDQLFTDGVLVTRRAGS